MAMETVPPEPVRDLTASDILSPQLWARSNTRPSLGLDVTCTKIAVDFQSMTEATAEACIRQNLDALREATHTDATFIALFDEETTHIESLSVSKGMFTQCSPEVLKGDPLEALPWLRSRLEHTRILELRDTANTRREQAAEGARLKQLNIGAVLVVGFAVQEKLCGLLALCSAQPREGWDVNLHLLLKLIGSSFASGLERMRVQKHLKSLQERTDLAMYTGNDGLVGFRCRAQSRLFLAALEGNARLCRRRDEQFARLAPARPSGRHATGAGRDPRSRRGQDTDFRKHSPHASPRRVNGAGS